MKKQSQKKEKAQADLNAARTAYEEGIPMASIEVHGDKWCAFGNDSLSAFVDNPLLYCKREVFGFALVE
jgi:hypothetical protein